MKHRLSVYHEQTEPLISYYRTFSESNDANAPSYILVNGIGSVESIRDEILNALSI